MDRRLKVLGKTSVSLVSVLNVQQDKTEAFCDKYLVSSISPRARGDVRRKSKHSTDYTQSTTVDKARGREETHRDSLGFFFLYFDHVGKATVKAVSTLGRKHEVLGKATVLWQLDMPVRKATAVHELSSRAVAQTKIFTKPERGRMCS